MGISKLKFSYFILFLNVMGCAHHTKPTRAQGSQVVITQPAIPNTNPDNNQAQLPTAVPSSSASDQSPPALDLHKARFAIWIDSYGNDAFAALGFLQELDKQGFSPVKIVGTGLGCWIAQSWGFAANGNRAEWQASKWNDWKSLNSSFLSRLRGSTSRAFEAEVLKISTYKNWNELSILSDCPLVAQAPPFHFVSARDLKPETAFWTSLQLEMFGVNDEHLSNNGYFSGSMAGAARAEELEDLSQEIKVSSDEKFVGWVILSTRGVFVEEAADQNPVRILLSGRDFNWPLDIVDKNSPESKLHVWKLDLAQGAKRKASDLILPENRRRYVLQGRKQALQILQSEDFKNFLK